MGLDERQTRAATKVEDGSVYIGEWCKNSNSRNGRGLQIYPDGSMFEGYWKDNKPNYYGRFVHKDGEMYQGEWQNDKPHGVGFVYH